MSILTGLTSYLLNNTAVTALVGTRIYPEKIPAGTTANPTIMPCLTYQLIDEPIMSTFDNAQLFRARIQIDTWGGNYKSAHAVADAVHLSLQGFRGHMGTADVGGVFRQAKRDNPDPDVELYRVSQDYFFNYTEG
jgi:hypothetical protein